MGWLNDEMNRRLSCLAQYRCKNIEMVVNEVKKQRDSLIVVGVFAVAYIIITALIMFNAEPETFPTMFDAIYWATVSLTTVGYGDLYATSQLQLMIETVLKRLLKNVMELYYRSLCSGVRILVIF